MHILGWFCIILLFIIIYMLHGASVIYLLRDSLENKENSVHEFSKTVRIVFCFWLWPIVMLFFTVVCVPLRVHKRFMDYEKK